MKRNVQVLFVAALIVFAVTLSPPAQAQGTWSPFDYYTQTSTYSTTVQPPINADGSSVWPAKKGGVVPVKFTLSVGLGALTIISATDGNATHADGGVSFTIPAGLTLNNMVSLNYLGTTVGCGAGSPRFTLDYGGKELFIYLGGDTGSGNPNDGCDSYAGANLLSSTTAARFEAIQLGNTVLYDTLPNILSKYGNMPIQGMWLVTDNGNSYVTLNSVNIQSTTYTFAATPSATCNLPPATIDLQQVSGVNPGTVDETVFTMAADNGNNFRTDGCQYAYNLNTKQLTAGNYKVFANINGSGDVNTGGQFALK
jgi:hypothetical protein